MAGILKYIVGLDQSLQQCINQRLQQPILDALAPVLREPKTWIPLYVLLAIWMPWRFGRKGIYWCLAFILTFGLGDFVSASMIKPFVARIRPCNDLLFAEHVRRLVDCGVGYSFPSTHATNHFALALFIGITLGKQYRWVPVAAVLWAFSVGFSQIYVGVHYPFDVIGGAFLGIIIGTCVAGLFMRRIGLESDVNNQ